MADGWMLVRHADGARIPLRAGRNELGRSAMTHVCLDDHSVSQVHAIIHVRDGCATLRDLGSTNGTWVNGKRVDEQALKVGDQLRLGTVKLSVQAAPTQETFIGAAASRPPSVAEALAEGGASEYSTSAGGLEHVAPREEACAPVRRRSSSEFRTRYAQLVEAQVTPDATRCVQCGICSYNCPAGIDVRGHARRGRPVVLSQCLTCGECVANCPRGVLAFERNPLFEGIDG